MGNYLNIPKKEKDSGDLQNESLRFGYSSMQGWRQTMEDSHFIIPYFDGDKALLGVFDGHGGSDVSMFCKENFAKELLKNNNYIQQNYK